MRTQAFKTLYIIFVLIFFSAVAYSEAAEQEISGEVTLENRYFTKKGQYGNDEKTSASLVLSPEYSLSWDDDRKIISFIPFAVLNEPDTEKTHFDIREASYVAAYDRFEIRAGISKVFWGVTESQHLVDVINQTDLILNTDGEDKLGQPMLNTTYISDFGNIDLFILPYFRERTFPGAQGRFTGPIPFETDEALYEDSDEEKHIDFAARYSHSFDALDLGLSVFHGTDREPIFTVNNTGTKLIPLYIQTTQIGLDAQYIFESWLFKLEGIHKQADLREDYQALTYGLEYTFSNFKSTGVDIGVLWEHLYDTREVGAVFKNHSFIGGRLALNDEMSTEFLAGGVINNEEGDLTSLRIEGSRRIKENWKWEIEAAAIVDPETSNPISSYRDDDYAQLSLSFFF